MQSILRHQQVADYWPRIRAPGVEGDGTVCGCNLQHTIDLVGLLQVERGAALSPTGKIQPVRPTGAEPWCDSNLGKWNPSEDLEDKLTGAASHAFRSTA